MTRLLRSMAPFAVLVLSSACVDGTVVDPLPPVQETNPTTPTRPTAPTDFDRDGIPDNIDKCPTQPETRNGVFDSDGCPDSPLDLYAAVRIDVEQFWSGYFTTVFRRQYTPLTAAITFSGGTVQTPCGPGQGPLYCPASLTMYLDLNFLQAQLTKIGDFAPAIIIAHEIGHHTQRLLGISSSGALSIQLELQADCLAGRWAASAAQRGFLEPGDIQEALTSLFTVGDPAGTPWFAQGAHGTSFQRQAAFQQGLNNLAC